MSTALHPDPAGRMQHGPLHAPHAGLVHARFCTDSRAACTALRPAAVRATKSPRDSSPRGTQRGGEQSKTGAGPRQNSHAGLGWKVDPSCAAPRSRALSCPTARPTLRGMAGPRALPGTGVACTTASVPRARPAKARPTPRMCVPFSRQLVSAAWNRPRGPPLNLGNQHSG